MPDLHIRQMKPEVIARLKAQAKRNHRSMEAEARALIEANVQHESMTEWLARMDEVREKYPIPWKPGDPTSAELIREEREERERTIERAMERDVDDADDRR